MTRTKVQIDGIQFDKSKEMPFLANEIKSVEATPPLGKAITDMSPVRVDWRWRRQAGEGTEEH